MRMSESFLMSLEVLCFIFGIALIVLFAIFGFEYIDHLYPDPFIQNCVCQVKQ